MTLPVIVDPIKSINKSPIVNKKMSNEYNVLSNPNVVSLPHYKNELVYNEATWAEWTIVGGTASVEGIELTLNGSEYSYAQINTTCRGTTKYGILINAVSNSISTTTLKVASYYTGTAFVLVGSGITGNIKSVFTTQSTITTNLLRLTSGSVGVSGNKIKFNNIKLFELPPNSEIESDFTNLSADQLMIKYASSNFTPGDVRVVATGRTIKNELDYTVADYSDWTIAGAGTTKGSTGIHLVTAASNEAFELATLCKNSQKYGLLYSVPASDLDGQLVIASTSFTGASSNLVSAVGNQKVILTSAASITNNKLRVAVSAGTDGKYVDFKDIRLFELPAGSEIESDFTNMTADQLALKYPMSIGSNGKTGGVKSVGQTITNLVTNGNFSQETSGWTALGSVLSTLNNILLITGSGTSTNDRATQEINIPFVSGKKIYVKSKLKATNAVCVSMGFGVYGSTTVGTVQSKAQTSPTQNTEYLLSEILTLPVDGAGNVMLRQIHSYVDAATANGKVMEVKEVLAIDLTATFGKGMEPDLATCDKIFQDWFDGSKTVTKVRAVGKNLFDGKIESGKLSATTGLNESDSTRIRTVNYQKVKPNTTYKTSKDGVEMSWGVILYDINKQFISFPGAINIFTTPANCHYVRGFRTSTDITERWQLEESPTATTYEPYCESSAIIPYELKQVGAVKDEYNIYDGVLTKRIEKKVLVAGDISLVTTNVNNDYVSIPLSALAGITSIVEQFNTNIYTSITKGFDNTTSSDLATNIWTHRKTASNLLIYVPNGTYANLAAAQTALTGQEIYYQLANPEIKKISSTPLKAVKGGTLYVERIDGTAVGCVPNLKVKYESI